MRRFLFALPAGPLLVAGALLVIASTTPTSATPPQASRITVETIDAEIRGVLRALNLGEKPTLELEGGTTLPLRDVLSLREITRRTGRHRELELTLADGSRLYGGLSSGSDPSNLSFNGPMLPDGVQVPLEWIRRLTYHGLFSDERPGDRAVPDIEAGEEGDVLVTTEGTRMLGIVERVDAAGVRFEHQQLEKVLDFEWAKVLVVAIAPLEDPPALPDGATEVVVVGIDGSRLRGSLESLDVAAETVKLNSPLLGELTLKLPHVHALELRLGRVAYLSEREPKEVEESCPYITDQLFEAHFHWQRDRSVKERQPLRVGDRTFARGLGVHSNSRLVFAVEPGDRVFQAWIGVDVTGQPQDESSPAGSVVFQVLVDGTVAFDSGNVSWRDPARRVEVPVAGKSELALVVKMGEALHILDRADWGDARILRD